MNAENSHGYIINISTQINNSSGSPIKYRYMFTKEMFYLTTHSTHFIYGYMASDIW